MRKRYGDKAFEESGIRADELAAPISTARSVSDYRY